MLHVYLCLKKYFPRYISSVPPLLLQCVPECSSTYQAHISPECPEDVGNIIFDMDLSYAKLSDPEDNFKILSLFWVFRHS
jgi:hypothetical protein